MLMLGMETAGSTASAALTRDGALLAEISLHHTRTHSETLMPMVEDMLAMCGVTPAMLHAVAVDCGPGSFTGVRIGVCAANAMGAALSIPVVGIGSLRALYENVSLWPGPVCALIDARNEGAYMAVYENGAALVPPAADTAEALLPLVPAGALFVGDGVQAYRDAILAAVRDAVLAPEAYHVARAGSLCRAAQSLLARCAEAGEKPPAEAAPLYLRPSQAERMWSARHGR